MPSLTKDIIFQALPFVLQEDTSLSALAEAVAEVLAEHGEETELAQIYTVIDSLPEAVLDILAEDYKIDWYNFDYPIQAKRNQVKTHWYIHRFMGTTGAVRKAIQAVYPNSDVEEWWQPAYEGGEPYHFRIVLEASAPIMPVTNTDILREVELYRSYRSVLDGVIYRSTVGIVIKSGRGWQNYFGRITGTYPVRRQYGDWEHGNVVVETSGGAVGHSVPDAGSLSAGTYPTAAKPGGISHSPLTVNTEKGGQVYIDPETGTVHSGVFPDARVQGYRTAGAPLLETAGGASVYENPATGETAAGSFPDAAVQGNRENNGLIAAIDGQGIPYTAPVCGVPKILQ